MATLPVKLLDVCHVPPLPSSSVTDLSLPLTFFDLFWLRFHAIERLFLYSLPEADDDSYFFDSVVPKLKHSLSVTLQHFLPLAGNIVWPEESDKPFIKYSPGDSVSFNVAQSDVDFNSISSSDIREALKSRSFVPHLHTSKTSTSLMALQVTLFPKRGFSIGIATHHAILDGKSSTMFMKAWAYLCRESKEDTSSWSLVKELRPFLERSVIKDPKGLYMNYLNLWNMAPVADGTDVNNANKSVEILPVFGAPSKELLVQTTFKLNSEAIEKLRKTVLSLWNKVSKEDSNPEKPIKLSTFVLTCAHMLVCIAKAAQLEESKKILFSFPADCRARLDPPIDPNYLGNCFSPCVVIIEHEEVYSEDGVAFVSKKICDEIERLETDALGRVASAGSFWSSMASARHLIIAVAGSPRFGVYETNFGWGKPDKVEIASVYRGGALALAESRDGDGVEIGYVCTQHEMDILADAFYKGLQA